MCTFEPVLPNLLAPVPCLCCICQRMCCRVRVKKESTNMLFLKNMNKMETLQEDACCSFCPCCCDQDDIENYIHFRHTQQTAYFKNRKDVTEAEALLTSYASKTWDASRSYRLFRYQCFQCRNYKSFRQRFLGLTRD